MRLACDVPESGQTITMSQVEYTLQDQRPVVVDGTTTIEMIGIKHVMILLDVSSFEPGLYTFRARWADATGWFGDWSDPFVAGRPGKPGSLAIVP